MENPFAKTAQHTAPVEETQPAVTDVPQSTDDPDFNVNDADQARMEALNKLRYQFQCNVRQIFPKDAAGEWLYDQFDWDMYNQLMEYLEWLSQEMSQQMLQLAPAATDHTEPEPDQPPLIAVPVEPNNNPTILGFGATEVDDRHEELPPRTTAAPASHSSDDDEYSSNPFVRALQRLGDRATGQSASTKKGDRR